MSAKKVILIEPSALTRASITSFLEKNNRYDLVGATSTIERADALIQQHQPQLILVSPQLSAEPIKAPLRQRGLHAEIIFIPPLEGTGEEAQRRRNHELTRKIQSHASSAAQRDYDLSHQTIDDLIPLHQQAPRPLGRPLIVIGSSTGGPAVLETILSGLPRDTPPILIAQHMPHRNLLNFAERLNHLCAPRICVVEAPTRVQRGLILIAPGDQHLVLQQQGPWLMACPLQGHKVNGHQPSVDVLFRSVANLGARDVTAVILTGMGNDGAQGLLELKRAGARTLAQNKDSSVVFGMPRAAWDLGAAQQQLSPPELLHALLSFAQQHPH